MAIDCQAEIQQHCRSIMHHFDKIPPRKIQRAVDVDYDRLQGLKEKAAEEGLDMEESAELNELEARAERVQSACRNLEDAYSVIDDAMYEVQEVLPDDE